MTQQRGRLRRGGRTSRVGAPFLPPLVAAAPVPGASVVGSQAARPCGRLFLRLCGRLPRGRGLTSARALPSSGALARRALVGGIPPALARLSAPVLALRAPPVRCGLRAGPLALPARPSSRALGGRSCPLRPGLPCRPAGAAPPGLARSSPSGGSRAAARRSGGCVPRPRWAGVWRAAARRPRSWGCASAGRTPFAGKIKKAPIRKVVQIFHLDFSGQGRLYWKYGRHPNPLCRVQ